MANAEDLPHLIRLLDDDSDVVRDAVLDALSAFGPFLEIELSRKQIATDPAQRHRLRDLLGHHARRWLERRWPEWSEFELDHERLEHAMALIAEFQYGPGYSSQLGPQLDRLAREFRQKHPDGDALQLATFLFKTKHLRGAEQDYYNPFHSNLLYVIEEGRGIPLSLAGIFILVGTRTGLAITGINFPGHFLASAIVDGRRFVIDCFNGGRSFAEEDLAALGSGPAAAIAQLLEAGCPAETIIARTLRNLVFAYKKEDRPENAMLMGKFLAAMEPSNHGTEGPEGDEG